jgi:hypothetical protein
VSAPTAWRLLTGSMTDGEYFRSLEADRFGLFYDVPRRGWAHRGRLLWRAAVELAALVACLIVLFALLWATSIPMGPVR